MGDRMEIGDTGMVPIKNGKFFDTASKKVVELKEDDKKKDEETKED